MPRSTKKRRYCKAHPDGYSWICCKCKHLRTGNVTICHCAHPRCAAPKPKPRKIPTRFNRRDVI